MTTKVLTALDKLKEFCVKEKIDIKLVEESPSKDKDILIHIPGIKLIVLYKDSIESKQNG